MDCLFISIWYKEGPLNMAASS